MREFGLPLLGGGGCCFFPCKRKFVRGERSLVVVEFACVRLMHTIPAGSSKDPAGRHSQIRSNDSGDAEKTVLQPTHRIFMTCVEVKGELKRRGGGERGYIVVVSLKKEKKRSEGGVEGGGYVYCLASILLYCRLCREAWKESPKEDEVQTLWMLKFEGSDDLGRWEVS